MTTDPMRPRALAALRSGRVTVLGVKLDAAWRPVTVIARVKSSRDNHRYRVRYLAGQWSCDCRDGQHGIPCAHTAAVALVTTETAA